MELIVNKGVDTGTILRLIVYLLPSILVLTVPMSIFLASVVLAIMILPIITAVAREVFVQTPPGQIEAALALVRTGGTFWRVRASRVSWA